MGKRGVAGGIAMGIISRRKSLERYYSNPKICLNCGKVIEVGSKRVGEIKRKNFCNHHCAAKYNNKRRKKNNHCKVCGTEIKRTLKYCKVCKTEILSKSLLNTTKKDLFDKWGYVRARGRITKNANSIFKAHNKRMVCDICGYDKYIEVCHIRAVKDFEDNAKIKDINSISNLVGLCSNHHKEFDNGLLKL